MSQDLDKHMVDQDDMWWAEAGRCAGVDPDVFFPRRGDDPGPAKAFCRACPVRSECLSWALESNQKHGIWGGMTESQRRRLRRSTITPTITPTITSTDGPTIDVATRPARPDRERVRQLHLVG